MGDGLTLGDVPALIRAAVDKMQRETPMNFVQFGTVVSVDMTDGEVPFATVHMDGDPDDTAVEVASLVSAVLFEGLRVAVMFDRPHGAYIIGSPAVARVPLGRGGMCTTGGGS